MLLVAVLAIPSTVEGSSVELRASPLVNLYDLVRAVADTAASGLEADRACRAPPVNVLDSHIAPTRADAVQWPIGCQVPPARGGSGTRDRPKPGGTGRQQTTGGDDGLGLQRKDQAALHGRGPR